MALAANLVDALAVNITVAVGKPRRVALKILLSHHIKVALETFDVDKFINIIASIFQVFCASRDVVIRRVGLQRLFFDVNFGAFLVHHHDFLLVALAQNLVQTRPADLSLGTAAVAAQPNAAQRQNDDAIDDIHHPVLAVFLAVILVLAATLLIRFSALLRPFAIVVFAH